MTHIHTYIVYLPWFYFLHLFPDLSRGPPLFPTRRWAGGVCPGADGSREAPPTEADSGSASAAAGLSGPVTAAATTVRLRSNNNACMYTYVQTCIRIYNSVSSWRSHLQYSEINMSTFTYLLTISIGNQFSKSLKMLMGLPVSLVTLIRSVFIPKC